MGCSSCFSIVGGRSRVFFLLSLDRAVPDADLGLVSDFAADSALRAWRLMEAEALVESRQLYVYQTPGDCLNIVSEAEVSEAEVSLDSLGGEADWSDEDSDSEVDSGPLVPLKGSLYLYRRLQRRALLKYFYLRRYRRRQLALLTRSVLSSRGAFSESPSPSLFKGLSRAFFFFSPRLIRSWLTQGGVYVNFKSVRGLHLRLRSGDFVSIALSVFQEGAGGSQTPENLLASLEGLRLSLAAKAIFLAAGVSAKSESRGLSEAR